MTGVAIRVDCTPRLGTGHLVRCLTLADHLSRRGATVTFVGRPYPEAVASRVRAAGHSVVELPSIEGGAPEGPWPDVLQRADAAAMVATLGKRADVVVSDHYSLGRAWEQEAREPGSLLVAIDDLADRPHDVDVLVDVNWVGPETARRYDDLLCSPTLCLLGPRYALLQDAYRDVRRDARPQRSRTIVASFGGSDPTGETRKLLEAVEGLEPAAVTFDLVLGGAFRDRADVRAIAASLSDVRIHEDLPTLAHLFAASDVAFGAGGVTTWERICVQVPSVVTTVAANQVQTARALNEAGVLRWLGHADATDAATYRAALTDALDGHATPPTPLVDGWGAARVAQAVLGPPRPMAVRTATRDDASVFVGPDRDIHGLMSYLQGPTAWDRGLGALDAHLAGDDLNAWVVLVGDVPVGGVLRRAGEGELPIWLDTSVAGQLDEEAVRQAVRKQL